MKKSYIFIAGLIIFIIGTLFFFSFKQSQKSDTTSQIEIKHNLRVGWQIPWATQGQLAQVLKQTDIY